MTTRNHATVNGQQKGANLPAGKPKTRNAPVDAKNRKALENIGNLVNLRTADGKEITRPITRTYGAKLLANAQVAAAANKDVLKKQVAPLPANKVAKKIPPIKNPKPVVVLANAQVAAAAKKDVLKKQVAPLPTNKVAKKNPAIKNPKPTVVVDNSSPITKQNEKMRKNKSHTSSSKRNVHSLTTVLSARSKIACGIVDIDAADADDELSMVEYVEDLYKFYKQHEKVCSPQDCMSSQVEINAKMRAILVDWLIEVHHYFELMPETLYLTIFIIDRFLSMEPVRRKELQLVGVSAMLIASKYEEIWSPEVNDFIGISYQTYTREQILRMEKRILNKLVWKLTFPTPYVFLVRFLKAAVSDKEMEYMTFFFAELALMHNLTVCPSLFAASAVYAARCTLKKSLLWNKTLEYHTGYLEKHLVDCAKLMIGYHSSATTDSKLTVVYTKYSTKELGSVALKSPATVFLKGKKLLT